MGKNDTFPEHPVLAEAPSVKKGEVFKATKIGLQRHRTQELRDGGKHNRVDDMPYWRVSSVSYEEKVLRRGSRVLAIVGLVMVLFGLGAPVVASLATVQSLISHMVSSSNLIGVRNALLVPDVATVLLGIALVARKFPRKVREGWWQLKDLTGNEMFGWQMTARARGIENFVDVVKQGIALSRSSESDRYSNRNR